MEYVYRYTRENDQKILYIGRTSDLDFRVLTHSKEPRFKEYEWDIDFIELKTRTDSEALESHFIEMYETYKDEGFNKRKGAWGLCSFAPYLKWKAYQPSNLTDEDFKLLTNRRKESYLDKQIAIKEKKLKELEEKIKQMEDMK